MPYPDDMTLAAGRQRTVLRLVCDGVARNYSDTALSIANAAGLPVDVSPGLAEPDMVDALGQPNTSLAVELLAPADHAAIIGGLFGAWAEVSQILEGQDWSLRRVVVRGYADAPIYGEEGEPIRFGLASAPWEDRGLIPLPSWSVGPETWPRAGSTLGLPEDRAGPLYPVVLGDPGNDADATTEADWYPIPALIVEIDTALDPADNSANACILLLGAGRLACVGGNVELFNETTGATVTLSPFATRDAMNQIVTCLEVAVGDMPITNGDALYWRPEAGGKAGIPGTGTAGGAIRWLAGFCSAEVDQESVAAASPFLDRWRVAAVISAEQPVSPWGWIEDHLLSVLPVIAVDGPGGVTLAPLPVMPADADGARVIDVEAVGGARSGPVEVSSWRDLSTALSLSYGSDPRTDQYRRRIDLDPTLTATTGSRQPTPYGAAASVRYGGLRLEEITLDAVCDHLTASALAEYHMRRVSQMVAEVEVVLPQSFQSLQSGDLVRLTLPRMYLPTGAAWTGVLCITLSVPRISGAGVYRFRTVPDWSCA